MTIERQSPRKVLDRILCLQLEPADQGIVHAIVLNISDRGLGFHALDPVTVSGTVRFSLWENGVRIDAVGEIVWMDATKRTGGLSFAALPQSSRERIRNCADHDPSATRTVASVLAAARSRQFALPRTPTDVATSTATSTPASASAGNLSRSPLPTPPQPSESARANDAPLPPASSPEPASTYGFALFDQDSQRPAYSWDQEMALPDSGGKFFRGFVMGAIVTGVLGVILFFAYSNLASNLVTHGRALTGANSAPPPTPAAMPPSNFPPAVPSAPPSAEVSPSTAPPGQLSSDPISNQSGSSSLSSSSTRSSEVPADQLPPIGADKAPVDSDVVSGANDNLNASRAAQSANDLPEPRSRATRAPANVSAKTSEPGNADLALAHRYLEEKTGPVASAVAAGFLWSAVQKGNVSAEITLADLYARGDGVSKSCDQARVLLRAAAEKGSAEASEKLAQNVRTDCH